MCLLFQCAVSFPLEAVERIEIWFEKCLTEGKFVFLPAAPSYVGLNRCCQRQHYMHSTTTTTSTRRTPSTKYYNHTFPYSMRVLLLLLLLGIVAVGVATEIDHMVATTLVPETLTMLASSISIIASPSDSSRIRRLRRSSPSPTPSPTYAPSELPSLVPIGDPTAGPSEGSSGYVSASYIYHTMWSFLCPLLSLSIMAWAVRRTTKRRYVCCGAVEDTVPGEIIVVEDDHSVAAGDCSTDVELMPVSTNRSHEWTDCGADAMADMPKHGSYDWTSDDDSIHVTTFVRMKE
jgi:hypothetical protein